MICTFAFVLWLYISFINLFDELFFRKQKASTSGHKALSFIATINMLLDVHTHFFIHLSKIEYDAQKLI
ncbi:hypothetical protein KP509_22G040500 [Ceratopteris richardii]|uniref:Uncharacterized protein n=1 Tax=Ceratopteris richardii TaxID=49495 RepID=A0A8T2S691_CERRI|nr:hypothetical protein KP509_22G040500 [Ceratopteris richardii]